MYSNLDYLKFCEAAYLDSVDLFEKELGISGKTKAYFGDSLHKYTIEFDDHYVIVFRGSVNNYDFMHDAIIATTDVDHVNIHSGFYSDIKSEINAKVAYDKPVFLCGHSLGGSLALIEAFILADIGKSEIKAVVTFGNAMPGARSFQEKYEFLLGQKTTSFVNGDDIVPSLPPFKFYPVGNIIRIGKQRSWFNPMKYMHIFSDHKISNYKKSLESLN